MTHRIAADSRVRYQVLDLIRGVAIALMFIYHFCFGLSQLGFIKVNFSTDSAWIGFRFVIVFLFLSLVGVGLTLVTQNGIKLRSYLKRLALLFVYAGSISLLSILVRPQYYVSFGILHLIFVSSIVGLSFTRYYWFNLALGILIIIAGHSLSFSQLDPIPLQWLGMSYAIPITDDFAPLFPWFGIVLVGMFLGTLVFEKNQFTKFKTWQSNHWLPNLLSWAGRYSVHLYYVHFQIFYLLVYLFT